MPVDCLIAARFVALALAICSRRAADVLRWLGSGDAASVGAVLDDVVELLEGIVPSHEVAEESREGFRVASELAATRSIAGKEGFLKSPPTELRGLDGRLATVLEPNLGGSAPCVFLAGLGLRVSPGVARLVEGNFDAEVSDGREAVLRTTGVFAVCPKEALVRGVPSIVDKGALNALVDPRRLESSFPPLDPGRLSAREEILLDPSEL